MNFFASSKLSDYLFLVIHHFFAFYPPPRKGGPHFPYKTNVYTVYTKFSSLLRFFIPFYSHLLLYKSLFSLIDGGQTLLPKRMGGPWPLGAVHKVRHAIFDQFLHPLPTSNNLLRIFYHRQPRST